MTGHYRSAAKPGLEVGEGAVGGQDQLALLAAPTLGDRAMIEAEIAEADIAAPAVGVDDRTGLDVRHTRPLFV